MKLVLAIIIIALCATSTFLFIRVQSLEGSIVDLKLALARESQGREREVDRRFAEVTTQIAAIESAISDQQRRIEDLESARLRHDALESTFATLQRDMVAGVESAYIKEIVDLAGTNAASAVMRQKFLTSDPDFLRALAGSIATSFQAQVRGEPGADANNERIAAILKSDPEFLDRVSVLLITQSED